MSEFEIVSENAALVMFKLAEYWQNHPPSYYVVCRADDFLNELCEVGAFGVDSEDDPRGDGLEDEDL